MLCYAILCYAMLRGIIHLFCPSKEKQLLGMSDDCVVSPPIEQIRSIRLPARPLPLCDAVCHVNSTPSHTSSLPPTIRLTIMMMILPRALDRTHGTLYPAIPAAVIPMSTPTTAPAPAPAALRWGWRIPRFHTPSMLSTATRHIQVPSRAMTIPTSVSLRFFKSVELIKHGHTAPERVLVAAGCRGWGFGLQRRRGESAVFD
jgi:hypothetical protein